MRTKLAVLVLVALVTVAVLAALEGLSFVEERRWHAYLWKTQDYLRVVSPSYHEGRGQGRLLIYGPSEAREALLHEELDRDLPALWPYQSAQSFGTLEDFLVILEYLERAYGPSAVPDVILLGITPRFIADIRPEASPLFVGINKYSPQFKVVEGQHPPLLVAKSTVEGLRARLALMTQQPERYRRAVMAFASRVAGGLAPASLEAYRRRWVGPAKYIDAKLYTDQDIRKWLLEPHSFWEKVHAWDPERDRARVTRELGLLRDYTTRHHIRLYVVNLPEQSMNRWLYLPGWYDAYLSIVKSALGDTPFLDLRTFLTDDEFYDEAHPTWRAAIRLSAAVADFLCEHGEVRRGARP